MATEDSIKKWSAAYNSGDVNRIAELFAQDAVVQHVFFPQPLRGRDAVRQAEGPLFNAFSTFQWKAFGVIAKGDMVVAERTVVAVNTGPLPTPAGMMPPTNKRVEIHGASFFRVSSNGLIAEEHRYFDVAGMMAQLGLMPK